MIKPLSERVIAAAEFYEVLGMNEYEEKGRVEENARLRPLIRALAACVDALDNAEDVLRIIYHTTEGSTRKKAHDCAAKLQAVTSEIEAELAKAER